MTQCTGIGCPVCEAGRKAKMDIKEAYKVMQGNCGIEVGDKVKILRHVKDNELGCSCAMTSDERAGDFAKSRAVVDRATGIVKTVYPNYIWVDLGNEYNGSWQFPFFALELVEKKAKEKMVDVDGKKVSLSTVKSALKLLSE